MDFYTFKNKVYKLNGNERTKYVVRELLIQNGIDDEYEQIPIFIGFISKDITRNEVVENIQTIYGTPIERNPFTENFSHLTTRLFDDKKKSPLAPGEKIIFIAIYGKLEKENEIIDILDYYSLKEFGLKSNVAPLTVINYLWRHHVFEDYNKEIYNLYNEKRELEQQMSKLERIKKEISELEEKKKEFESLKYDIKKEFPSGLDKARAELNDLTEERDALEDQISYLSGKESEYKEYDRKLSTLKEEKATITKCGKSIDDVLIALDEYNKIKLDIDNAKDLHNWYLGPAEDTDLKLPIDLGRIHALDYLKEHLEYDYSDKVMVQFLSALSTTQVTTMFGKPGTGKTTFVNQMAKALGAKCTIISVQNNWTDVSDILGYFNPINNSFSSTKFLEAMLDAKKEYDNVLDNSKLHIICLDEMNLARVEYYFAEFLSLLQLDENERVIHILPTYIEAEIDELKKSIDSNVDYDDQKFAELSRLKRYHSFKIPPNVRFVGTINSDDTTNDLSPKVIDRSMFIELTSDDYSTKKAVNLDDSYFPLSFFRVDDEEYLDDIFDNENGRFRHYLQQMYSFYVNKLELEEDDDFADYIILSKILPAQKKASEFVNSNYNDAKYPLSSYAFRSRQPESGDYFNYLGGD